MSVIWMEQQPSTNVLEETASANVFCNAIHHQLCQFCPSAIEKEIRSVG
jgi:hypothetical protein